jgi:hypothetical protein
VLNHSQIFEEAGVEPHGICGILVFPSSLAPHLQRGDPAPQEIGPNHFYGQTLGSHAQDPFQTQLQLVVIGPQGSPMWVPLDLLGSWVVVLREVFLFDPAPVCSPFNPLNMEFALEVLLFQPRPRNPSYAAGKGVALNSR